MTHYRLLVYDRKKKRGNSARSNYENGKSAIQNELLTTEKLEHD